MHSRDENIWVFCGHELEKLDLRQLRANVRGESWQHRRRHASDTRGYPKNGGMRGICCWKEGFYWYHCSFHIRLDRSIFSELYFQHWGHKSFQRQGLEGERNILGTYLEALPPIIHRCFHHRSRTRQEPGIENQDIPGSHCSGDIIKSFLVADTDYVCSASCCLWSYTVFCFLQVAFIAAQENYSFRTGVDEG